MSNLLTIDSSVYLSAFIPADLHHDRSNDFLKKVAKGRDRVVLPALIPLEISNVLLRKHVSLSKVGSFLEGFYGTPRTQIVPVDFSLSRILVARGNLFDLKTSDWIIATTCYHLRARLVTWDKTLIEKTKAHIECDTPP